MHAKRSLLVVLILPFVAGPSHSAGGDTLTADGVTAWLTTNAAAEGPDACSGETRVTTSPLPPDVLSVTVTTAPGDACSESLVGLVVVRIDSPTPPVVPASEPSEGGYGKANAEARSDAEARRRTATGTAEERENAGGGDYALVMAQATQSFGYDGNQVYHFSGSPTCSTANHRYLVEQCAGDVENYGPGYAQYRATLWTHDRTTNRFYHTLKAESIAYPDGYVRAECWRTGSWSAASYVVCRAT